MIWNVPNILTMLRIALVPIFAIFFFLPISSAHWFTASLFFVAALTDWFDGFIARKFNQTSKLGAFLDPVADKLMVAVALVLLLSRFPYWWVALPVASIIARELIVSALREWMAEIGERAAVKVSSCGKIKTVAQMSAILLLLVNADNANSIWVVLGFILLYVAVILTIYSMWLYLKAGYYALKSIA
ncbi:MAG: CDP-diacylglycerol--glycerol-3-phosphate 3-phosphatidyltransferase [Francisellaceae bacterium]